MISACRPFTESSSGTFGKITSTACRKSGREYMSKRGTSTRTGRRRMLNDKPPFEFSLRQGYAYDELREESGPSSATQLPGRPATGAFWTICPSLIARVRAFGSPIWCRRPLTKTEGLLKQLATLLPLKEHELILVHVHDTGARGEWRCIAYVSLGDRYRLTGWNGSRPQPLPRSSPPTLWGCLALGDASPGGF